jgi:hypothetical protein
VASVFSVSSPGSSPSAEPIVALRASAGCSHTMHAEHATRIPFMISVPGFRPGRADALVEQVYILK